MAPATLSLFLHFSDQRNYDYVNAHVIDGNITPPDPDQPFYAESDDDYYDDDYAQYPYTFNNHYYG